MRAVNRKDFLKKVCISGACFCGFSGIVFAGETNNTVSASENEDKNLLLAQAWISNLLTNINANLNEDQKRKILKSCALAHYDSLKMDEILKPYIRDLSKFNDFLKKEWDWKIEYNPSTKTLIADENKNHCVCPLINKNNETDKSAICYCSEGFAEKMFSTVTGEHTSATVISSIHRGDKSCKYKVVFG